MSARDLSTLDRTVFQPLGRLIQEAFADGLAGTIPITGALHVSGSQKVFDNVNLDIGTTITTAETRVRVLFDETTTGIGHIQLGSDAVPMVYNTNPGASAIPAIDINIEHSAGAGDGVWLRGILSKMTISGDGDNGTKLNPIQATLIVDGAISSAYGLCVSAIHKSTDDVTGAMAAANFDLKVQDEDFEAVQTLQTLICTMSSDAGRTVTCTSGNWNLALLKNMANVDGLNAILKLVDLGDNTASIIEVGSGSCDRFIFFVNTSTCIVANSDGVASNRTHKIKCNFGGIDFYLNGYAA